MTLKEMREVIAREPKENDHMEIKIWLPGSRLSLHSSMFCLNGDTLMIEGEVELGSYLIK